MRDENGCSRVNVPWRPRSRYIANTILRGWQPSTEDYRSAMVHRMILLIFEKNISIQVLAQIVFPSLTDWVPSKPIGARNVRPVEPLDTTTQLEHGTPKCTTIRRQPRRMMWRSNLGPRSESHMGKNWQNIDCI